jgi:hypothetical protein
LLEVIAKSAGNGMGDGITSTGGEGRGLFEGRLWDTNNSEDLCSLLG